MDKYPSYLITQEEDKMDKNVKYTKVITLPSCVKSIILERDGLYFSEINSDKESKISDTSLGNIYFLREKIEIDIGYAKSSYIYHDYCKEYNCESPNNVYGTIDENINGIAKDREEYIKIENKLDENIFSELRDLFIIETVDDTINISFKEKIIIVLDYNIEFIVNIKNCKVNLIIDCIYFKNRSNIIINPSLSLTISIQGALINEKNISILGRAEITNFMVIHNQESGNIKLNDIHFKNYGSIHNFGVISFGGNKNLLENNKLIVFREGNGKATMNLNNCVLINNNEIVIEDGGHLLIGKNSDLVNNTNLSKIKAMGVLEFANENFNSYNFGNIYSGEIISDINIDECENISYIYSPIPQKGKIILNDHLKKINTLSGKINIIRKRL